MNFYLGDQNTCRAIVACYPRALMLIFSKLIYIRNKHDFTCVKLHSSFRKCYGGHHDCVLPASPGKKSNTTNVTSGAGITCLSGSPVYIHPSPVYSRVRVARSSVKYFVNRCFSFFHLAIVLSDLLGFTDSDNLFGIFKIVLQSTK